jgi:hypothetical protein
MPKLSNKTLDKMFICPNCGKPLRTRQGLSGHIQFKHKSELPAEEESFVEKYLGLRDKSLKFKSHASVAGFNEEEISKMLSIFLSWERIKTFFKLEQINISSLDFKNYLIMSLAEMQANQHLYRTLATDLSNAMVTGFTSVINKISATKAQS